MVWRLYSYDRFMIVFRYNGLASNAVGTSGLWSFGPAPATSTFKVENATTMVIRGKGKPATSTMPRIRDTIEQKRGITLNNRVTTLKRLLNDS